MSINFKKIANLLEVGNTKAVRKLLPKIRTQAPKAAIEIEAQILTSEARFDDALDILRPYIQAYPLAEIGYYNLISFIRVLMAVKAWDEAFSWCMKAIDFDDKRVEAPEQMYAILTNTDRWYDAIHVARRLQENFPDRLKYKIIRLVAEGRVQNHEKAMELWEEIRLQSDSDEVRKNNQLHNSLISLYISMGRIDDAWDHAESFELFSRKDPVLALGMPTLFQVAGRHEEGLRYLEDCVERWPDIPEFRWNLALMQLANGDMVKGWESYERRWDWDKFPSPCKRFSIPQLALEDALSSRSLYLWGEQGLGDNLMFLSFVPALLKEQPSKIICEIPPKLIPFVEKLYPEIEFVEFQSQLDLQSDERANTYDYHLPVGSLVRRYVSCVEDFKKRTVRKFRVTDVERLKLLGGAGGKKIVGLAWRSGLVNYDRRKFYLNANFASALMRDHGSDVTFLILQYSLTDQEKEVLAENPNCVIPDVEFFDDILCHAKFAACCDLVITPPTILVSLSGHANVPVISWGPKNAWTKFGTGQNVWWRQNHSVSCDPGWDKGAVGAQLRRLAAKAIELL